MNREFLLAVLIVLTVALSVSTIYASEVNVTDTYTSSSDDMYVSVYDSNVDNDSSNDNILKSDNSDSLSTYADSKSLVGSEDNADVLTSSSETPVSAISTSKTITSSDLTKYYKGSERYTATFRDSNGNVLKNTDVKLTIVGKTYTVKTDSNGVASLAINLKPNTYKMVANNPVTGYSLTNTIKVLSTITASDLTKYYKGSERYTATFRDSNGNVLKNTDVKLTVVGKTYTVKTDSKGVASLAINLKPNTYKMVATNPKNAENLTTTVKVLSTITSSDLTKYFKGSEKYTATFHESNGNLLKNTDVQLTVLGKTYTVKTNSNGVASLDINLKPGSYKMAATNPVTAESLTTNINVLPTIASSDLTKYYQGSERYTATFYDTKGNVLKNTDVKFTIIGKTYTVKTDSKGVASLAINVRPNTYQLVAANPVTGYNVTNTVTVLPTVASSDLTKYYKGSERFTATFHDTKGNVLKNTDVKFTIIGKTYTVKTDSKGVASLAINVRPNTYQLVTANPVTGYSVTNAVTVLPTVASSDLTKYYKGSAQYKATFHDPNGSLLKNTDVKLTVVGKTYTVKTDSKGVASLDINLKPGSYKIVATNPKNSEELTTSVIVLSTIKASDLTKVYNDGKLFYATFLNSEGKALANTNVQFKVNGQTYTAKTNSNGVASLSLDSLNVGTYTIVSCNVDGLTESSTVKVTAPTTYSGYGYWLFGGDMKNVNLNTLASQGTTDIFLNYYAISAHGQSAVESWIASANNLGIRVHIWMQSFYGSDGWVNPVNGGSIDTAFFNQKISEAKSYASIKGISGIHLDYLRYPGTAYKTAGGSDAISEFTKQVAEAVRSVNSNIIVSCALMPETTNNEYYYGQDYSEISQYVDVVVPMVYKGNYKQTSSWIASTTKWFVDNSKGAQVWVGLQGYKSDDDVTKLPTSEITNDVKVSIDAKATGAVIFRWGVANLVDFNSLDDDSSSSSTTGTVSISDILTAATNLKNTIASGKNIPTSISVGGVSYTTAQFLYLMTSAIEQLNNGKTSAKITPVESSAPSNPSSTAKDGTLTLSEYVDLASRVASFIKSNGQAPNYANSALGHIQYSSLIDAFSRILAFYKTNDAMPNSVKVYADVSSSLSSAEASSSSSSSSSSSGTTSKTISIKDIITGSTNLKNYYASNGQLPNTVTAGGVTFTLAEFVYLMSQAIYQVGDSNSTNIAYITGVSAASSPSGDAINGNLERDGYLTVANNVANFIRNYNQAPNYASSDLGKINYNALTDAFSRVLAYYGTNDMLPNYVVIQSSSTGSGTVTATGSGLNEKNTISNLEAYLKSSTNCQVNNSAIKSVVDSVTSGLTSDYDKAQAIYNYVRDSISYSFYYDTKYGAVGTLNAKTGNCVDQAHLLVAMYRTAGLASRYVHGTCVFSSGSTYGHVWTQVLIDGNWVVGDPTSSRNSFGNVVNWNTNSYSLKGIYSGISF